MPGLVPGMGVFNDATNSNFDTPMPEKLTGYRILILETREEAQFARLFREQGADVLQCPMFTINDAPDPAPVEAWIRRCIDKPFDDLVLMTGEGLRRIMKVVRRLDLEQPFVAALAQARKFSRGPKPQRALRELSLEADIVTEKPTSEGIAATLGKLDIAGRRIGLQLYPERDHSALLGFIAERGASVDTVLPYVYDRQAAETHIVTAIEEMAAGRVDAIALTSSGQVRRLVEAAKANGLDAKLLEAMDRTPVASVGPIVSEELAAYGFKTDLVPREGAFFMRPLIAVVAAELTKAPPRAQAAR